MCRTVDRCDCCGTVRFIAQQLEELERDAHLGRRVDEGMRQLECVCRLQVRACVKGRPRIFEGPDSNDAHQFALFR
jgi:hypothetical protein